MQHEIETQWMGKMQFNALIGDHTLVMDTTERVGGEDQGPIPKPLILTALSGCTGMDVVALLRKQNIELKELDIKVQGELSKGQPMEYIGIHLIYNGKGNEQEASIFLNAIQDSQYKYCGVSSMLKKALPVTWEVLYNGVLLFDNKEMKIQHS